MGTSQAVSALKAARRINIACHVNPDGDALGSALALSRALMSLGKQVTVGWGSEVAEVLPNYRFLPQWESLVAADKFGDSDVFVSLDCGSADRLELLEDLASNAPVWINIDHHVSNNGFGHIQMLDTAASSTAELVFGLISALGGTVDEDIATCLLTGIITDTGRFCYRGVSPRTHIMAGALIKAGARPDLISQAIYESKPFGLLRVLGVALARASLGPKMVSSYVTQQDVREAGIDMGETEEIIDAIRCTREVDVACVFKETEEGTWRGSMRSKGATDVSKIAVAFGGGGHRLAAGFESKTSLEETLTRVESLLE